MGLFWKGKTLCLITEEIQEIIFLFLDEKICCDPTLIKNGLNQTVLIVVTKYVFMVKYC